MIILEMKAVVKPSQCSDIDDTIRTVQFIRNKALRLWMGAKREGKVDIVISNKYDKSEKQGKIRRNEQLL